MNVREQVEALDKLIQQEKKQIGLRGDKTVSEKYTILVTEKNKLQALMTEYGEDFETELSASLVPRARSLDEGKLTYRIRRPLSFLNNFNGTLISTTDETTDARSSRAPTI
jgi:hypothetical protein